MNEIISYYSSIGLSTNAERKAVKIQVWKVEWVKLTASRSGRFNGKNFYGNRYVWISSIKYNFNGFYLTIFLYIFLVV
jgi:hypothetical protein